MYQCCLCVNKIICWENWKTSFFVSLICTHMCLLRVLWMMFVIFFNSSCCNVCMYGKCELLLTGSMKVKSLFSRFSFLAVFNFIFKESHIHSCVGNVLDIHHSSFVHRFILFPSLRLWLIFLPHPKQIGALSSPFTMHTCYYYYYYSYSGTALLQITQFECAILPVSTF